MSGTLASQQFSVLVEATPESLFKNAFGRPQQIYTRPQVQEALDKKRETFKRLLLILRNIEQTFDITKMRGITLM